jgi:hypothetical protein
LALRAAAILFIWWVILYPLSFGPACWLMDRDLIRSTDVFYYRPFVRWMLFGPDFARSGLGWYSGIGSRNAARFQGRFETRFFFGQVVSTAPGNPDAIPRRIH